MKTLDKDIEIEIVAFWWKQIERNHRLFFRLIDEPAASFELIPNLELIINQLEHSYIYLIRISYPNEADTLRQHLFSATRNLIDSLRRLKKNQKHESMLILNLAHNDMSLLRYELMALGIS